MWICEGKPYVLGRWWVGLCGLHTLGCQLCPPRGCLREGSALRPVGQLSGPSLETAPRERVLCQSPLLLDWGGWLSVVCKIRASVFLVLRACLDQFLHQESTRILSSSKESWALPSVD